MQVARSPVTISANMAYVSEVNSSITTVVEDKKPDGWVSRMLGRFFK